jgi:hypothetical protein
MNTVLSSNDEWVYVSSLIAAVWVVVKVTLTSAVVTTGHHRSYEWLTS